MSGINKQLLGLKPSVSGGGLLLGYDSVRSAAVRSDVSAAAIPHDDTIPQISEGVLIFTLPTYTPKQIGSRIIVEADAITAIANINNMTLTLFLNGASDAVQVSVSADLPANSPHSLSLRYEMTTTALTGLDFTLRYGPRVSTNLTLNGASGARLFGGAASSGMNITEYAPS